MCFELFSLFKIFKASSLEFGLLINSLFKEITLSAPSTNLSWCLLLTWVDLISAKFFEISNGPAPFAIRDDPMKAPVRKAFEGIYKTHDVDFKFLKVLKNILQHINLVHKKATLWWSRVATNI